MAKASTKKEDDQLTKDEEKKKLLAQAMAEIEKKYNQKGLIRTLEDKPEEYENGVIPTGSLNLDICTGIGGYPKGRIVEIYGPEGSGKSTLAATAVAQCQKMGGTAAYIDTENALDPVYFKKLGVNTDALVFSQPDYAEQALDIANELAKSQTVDLIVIDSVAAMTTQTEMDGDFSDNNISPLARLMSKAVKQLATSAANSNCTIIFINQLRTKISTGFATFGGPTEITTGGAALKYAASLRIDVRKVETLKDSEKIYGSVVQMKVTKNKVAVPFKSCKVNLIFGKGFSFEAEVTQLAIKYDLISKSGSFFSYEKDGQPIKIGQGINKVYQFIADGSEDALCIIEKVKQLMKEDMTNFNNNDDKY